MRTANPALLCVLVSGMLHGCGAPDYVEVDEAAPFEALTELASDDRRSASQLELLVAGGLFNDTTGELRTACLITVPDCPRDASYHNRTFLDPYGGAPSSAEACFARGPKFIDWCGT